MTLQDLLELCEKDKILFKNFFITYSNRESAEQAVHELTSHAAYAFTSEKEQPFIIDVGSGIGISTLYFKSIFPQAKILCFEPDPSAFALLGKNIFNNHIDGVDTINYAVSKEAGKAQFFGKFSGDAPDNSRNSIIEAWGCQYKENESIEVNSVKLSTYVNTSVDMLKLDVGGCEQQILEELETEKKLPLIREIAIEMHQAHKIKHINSIPKIYSILRKNNFEVMIAEKDSTPLMSNPTKDWARRLKPQLFMIRAKKLEPPLSS